MEVKAKVDGEVVGRGFARSVKEYGDEVLEVMKETAEEISDAILFRGMDDIASAGNFGEEWQDAFNADITESQRTITIDVTMDPEGPPVTFWHVFEYGAVITAHNSKGLLTWPNKSAFSIGGVTPAFISKASVTIPKKFHLHEIAREEAAKLREVFKRLMSERQG